MAVTLQWLWVLVVGLPQLIETGLLDSLMSTAPVEPASAMHPVEFSPVLAIAAGVITLAFLVLTIIIFIKLPKAISMTGERIVHQSTNAVVPIVTQHKKIPAKKKRLISRRITKIIQLLLVIIPLVTSFFIPPVQTITSQIITTLAILLAGFSTVCFVISWLIEPRATSRTRSHVSHE